MNRVLATATSFAVLWFVAWMGFSACDGGGHHDGGSDVGVSFSGSWEGTWTTPTTAPSGALTLRLEQTGATVTGTGTFAGHACLANLTVSCQVRGHEMTGWFNAGPMQMMFEGSCPESDHCTGTHHANTLTATYEIQGGPCAGESGVIQLTPVQAYEGEAAEVKAVYVGELILVDPADGDVVQLPVFERP